MTSGSSTDQYETYASYSMCVEKLTPQIFYLFVNYNGGWLLGNEVPILTLISWSSVSRITFCPAPDSQCAITDSKVAEKWHSVIVMLKNWHSATVMVLSTTDTSL